MTTARIEAACAGFARGFARIELRVPSDKSLTQRALLLAALAEGRSRIASPLCSEDALAVRDVIVRLGARCAEEGGAWTVQGLGGRIDRDCGTLDLRNSGTGARLMLGLLAGFGGEATLTGDASLRQRPMLRVVEPLRAMGARIEGPGRHLPIHVARGGVLAPYVGEVAVPSAQVKSAILLAALGADGVSRVREKRATRDHTERMLPCFGVPVVVQPQGIEVAGPARLRAAELCIPADPSSAAFFAAAAALAGPGTRIELLDVLLNPGRIEFFHLLQEMGAQVAWSVAEERSGEPVGRVVVEGATLRGTAIEPARVPALIDELPLVALLGARASGTTTVAGAEELRIKESDRIRSIGEGLGALGVPFEERPDGFRIEGGARLRGARVRSHGDHRIAMVLAVAALFAAGTTEIEGAECAAVSYPGFFEDLRRLAPGARIDLA